MRFFTLLFDKNMVEYIYLPVAQLDSASDSDSEGQRFESARVGQKSDRHMPVGFFIVYTSKFLII